MENVKLKRPGVISPWVLNTHKAPIPTRHEVWDHPLGYRVISTIEFTGKKRGIEFHLSISSNFGKSFPEQYVIEKVRKDFSAEDFEQDDHGSKVAHLWLPIEKDKRGECECKRE